MEISIETIDDIMIVQFIGNLDTGTANEAEDRVNKELENQPKKMIFDLGQSEFVSSAGLRVFLSTAKQMSAYGGLLKLCSANEVVKDILEMSGFVTFIDLKDNLEEAKADF
jgi:anti-sigma B factor antagonist